jgi:nitrogen PTS system EIIA component
MLKIINPRLIFLLEAENQHDALKQIVDAIAKEGIIPDPQSFLDKVLEREKIVSTSIGRQVALPHAKVKEIPSFFCAIALLSRGVNWHSIDNMAVRLIFLIGGPTGKETEYLQILSQITHLIKDEEVLKKILTSKSREAIIQILG